MKRWWLDELAHAGPEHLDPSYVAGYERKGGYDPAEPLLDRTGFTILDREYHGSAYGAYLCLRRA